MSPATDRSGNSARNALPGGGLHSDARYIYRAVRQDGALETGTLHGASRDDATAAIVARGLFPLDVRRDASAADTRTTPKVGDLALGLRLLASLLEAGLPMERALAVFATLAPRGWTTAAVTSIRSSVREGRSLTSALGAAPIAFPPLVLGMVAAGEAGTGLPHAVRRAADIMEKAAATRSAIRGALVYPMILGVAGALSVTLLVGFVIPRFAAVVEDLGETLPASTRFVLDAADMARTMLLPAAVAVIAGVVLFRSWLASSESSRVAWHGALLSLPVAGSMRLAAATSRVSAALAGLLASGVPIASGLLHAARTAGDAAIARRMLDARDGVVGGERLSSALARTRALTPAAIQLVRAGEATGDLASMLDHAARLEGEWAEERVKSLVRLLEPALILVFGAIVALIAAALLQAVYGVRPVA